MAAADRKPLPHQLVWEARQVVEAHGMFIIEVEEKDRKQPGKTLPAWVLYRKARPGEARDERLGRRSHPEELLRWCKTFVPKKEPA
jgi:hypothetical protein